MVSLALFNHSPLKGNSGFCLNHGKCERTIYRVKGFVGLCSVAGTIN